MYQLCWWGGVCAAALYCACRIENGSDGLLDPLPWCAWPDDDTESCLCGSVGVP